MTARAHPRADGERSSLPNAQLVVDISHVLGISERQLRRVSVPVLRAMDALTFDDLTGALVRGPGFHRLNSEIAAARAAQQPLSVMYVDVDGLKMVNDHFGHGAGDELLRGVVNALGELGIPRHQIVRLGGDEFVAILPNHRAADARQLRSQLAERLGRDGRSVSSGSAALTERDTIDRLVGRADRGQKAEKQTRSDSRRYRHAAAPAAAGSQLRSRAGGQPRVTTATRPSSSAQVPQPPTTGQGPLTCT